MLGSVERHSLECKSFNLIELVALGAFLCGSVGIAIASLGRYSRAIDQSARNVLPFLLSRGYRSVASNWPQE